MKKHFDTCQKALFYTFNASTNLVLNTIQNLAGQCLGKGFFFFFCQEVIFLGVPMKFQKGKK